MNRIRLVVTAAALVALLGSCDDSGDGGLGVDATGTVEGVVWLDRNGNGSLDSGDGAVADVRVELLDLSGRTALYSAETASDGTFRIPDVLVGDYEVGADSATVGDSISVLRIDSAVVTVAAGQTTGVLVGLSYPSLPVDSARALPPNTRVFVDGLVLTRWGTFGEATLHVRDTTGAIRAVRALPTAVATGDSVRVVAVTAVQLGQTVLKDAEVLLLSTGLDSPDPDTITTAEAATARDGTLDADLVRLDSAVVRDTSRNASGELQFTVDDGTGPVDIVLDRDISYSLTFENEVVGTILRATGVLIPASTSGPWVLKPRSGADITVGPLSYPALTVAEARDEPVDVRLVVEGIALNGWSTFRDSTLHVRDATAAIRSVRVPRSSVVAGDSLRVVGTTTRLLGQPVLTELTIRVLESTGAAEVRSVVSTATAANADGGTLDADLVRIEGAEVRDSTRTADGEFALIVDDGSGPVNLVFDRDIVFVVDFGASILGSRIQATGLLLPATGGRWVMKPRRSADIVVE